MSEYVNSTVNSRMCYSNFYNYSSIPNTVSQVQPISNPVPVIVKPPIFNILKPKLLSYYNPDTQLHKALPGMGIQKVPSNRCSKYKIHPQILVKDCC